MSIITSPLCLSHFPSFNAVYLTLFSCLQTFIYLLTSLIFLCLPNHLNRAYIFTWLTSPILSFLGIDKNSRRYDGSYIKTKQNERENNELRVIININDKLTRLKRLVPLVRERASSSQGVCYGGCQDAKLGPFHSQFSCISYLQIYCLFPNTALLFFLFT